MNIPLNIDWQQILLHLFNFAILAGGLYLLLYRPVKDFMKKREEHYQSMDEAAERARADAAQLQEQWLEEWPVQTAPVLEEIDLPEFYEKLTSLRATVYDEMTARQAQQDAASGSGSASGSDAG